MKVSAFKIKKELKSVDEFAEALKPHLDSKFKITVEKAGSGLKKFMTGNSADVIKIKKNAYHGVILTMSDKNEALDYQAIGINMYVPSTILNQVVGHEGFIDRAICHIFFGKGTDLYDTIQEKLASEFDGKPIDMGLLNSAKAMLKGKSVFDDE